MVVFESLDAGKHHHGIFCNSTLVGQSLCVWRLDERKSRSGEHLPPPPTCSATLLSSHYGWGRLSMRSLSYCFSDKAVGKVISVQVLLTVFSSHHWHSSAENSLLPSSMFFSAWQPACLTQGGSLWITSAAIWCTLLVFSIITEGGVI